ncbi:MAG: family acetyltransferase [Myxococcales bacterium]|nr:family acetyltransferase [Myxococcales bacterium]
MPSNSRPCHIARMIPELVTERLTMSGPTLADFDDSVAMWGDPDVVKHIGGKPFTREEVWSRLLRYVGHWSLMGHGFWVVRDRMTRNFVGEVGIAQFKRQLEPPLDAPEVGWVLATSAHGKGYATEAVNAALAWGNRLGDRFSCLIDAGNVASIRVAQKCGFQERTRTTYHGEPATIFVLDRSPAREL